MPIFKLTRKFPLRAAAASARKRGEDAKPTSYRRFTSDLSVQAQ